MEPALELIEDASLALKWANGALSFRFFQYLFFALMEYLTDGKNGEKILNVDPETTVNYRAIAFLNMLGLPVDITYFLFLNTAKDGNTQAVAQNTLIQIVAFGNLVISALGSLLGVLFNALMQLSYWNSVLD